MKDYLLRVWGRDEDAVKALKTPDYLEPDHAICYWFNTSKERSQFVRSLPKDLMVVWSEVDKDHEHDVHAETVVTVTLLLPDGRKGTFEQSYGCGYPDDSVHYMWENGNYSCDCNRRLFLARYCGIDPENADLDTYVECGDSIRLLSLKIEHRPLNLVTVQ